MKPTFKAYREYKASRKSFEIAEAVARYADDSDRVNAEAARDAALEASSDAWETFITLANSERKAEETGATQ